MRAAWIGPAWARACTSVVGLPPPPGITHLRDAQGALTLPHPAVSLPLTATNSTGVEGPSPAPAGSAVGGCSTPRPEPTRTTRAGGLGSGENTGWGRGRPELRMPSLTVTRWPVARTGTSTAPSTAARMAGMAASTSCAVRPSPSRVNATCAHPDWGRVEDSSISVFSQNFSARGAGPQVAAGCPRASCPPTRSS